MVGHWLVSIQCAWLATDDADTLAGISPADDRWVWKAVYTSFFIIERCVMPASTISCASVDKAGRAVPLDTQMRGVVVFVFMFLCVLVCLISYTISGVTFLKFKKRSQKNPGWCARDSADKFLLISGV